MKPATLGSIILLIAVPALTGLALLRAAESESTPSSVADLAAKLESGEITLTHQSGPLGYLPSLLQHLDISPASQLLAFSKTSFQAAIISPKNPRAVYFNDNTSVGFVPGGDVLELISLTPKDGLFFYTLSTERTAKPLLERRDAVCFSCHVPQSKGIPSMLTTSVFPDPTGMPLFVGRVSPPIDHRSPFEDRWGGWYVSGTHGTQHHRGNAVVPKSNRPTDLETANTPNLTDLSERIDLSRYLTPASDIVALMTLEHQTAMTNYLARLSPSTSLPGDEVSTTGEIRDDLIDEVVSYMLFSAEMPIREPIEGNTMFAKEFANRGPRDSKGRSLRDFDLKTRMFKFPLSYMIYSDAFENMRPSARDKIYRRLYDVLTAKTTSPNFAHLSLADRQAILEIVRETKPNLPDYWAKN